MDGIEKITARIGEDTQKEIDGILAQAKSQVEEIAASSRAQAAALSEELAAKGKRNAQEREERMASVAQMDSRKVALAVKQEMLDKAFDLALEKLCSLREEEYVDLLSKLLVKASRNGHEQVIFNQKDRTRVGKLAVTRANELMSKPSAAPRSGGQTKASALVDKLTGGSVSKVQNAQQGLTLAAETREIQGGFILMDGKVETNCAFETLVRLEKNQMSGEVAKVLFD